MAKKKIKKSSKYNFNVKHFIYITIIISIIIGIVFLTREKPAEAAASFYTNQVTPNNEVRRGGPLIFDVMVLGQQAGDSVNTGIEYDKNKLRIDNIEAGLLGPITWEPIADNNDKARIIITNANVAATGDNQQFARIHFTIIDQTDETDAQGRGFVELCTTFVPDVEPPTRTPSTVTTSTPQPTTNTNNPTNVVNTPIPTRGNEPAPTTIPISNLDKTKLCIPLEVNGSPADKMDFIFIPLNYDNYDIFAEQAQLAVQRMGETNLSQYRTEVLDKINWYMLNNDHESIPAQYRGRAITPEEQDGYMSAVHRLCPHDRYVYFVDAEWLATESGATIGGSAYLYTGLIFAARSVYDANSNIFPHEWGHAAAGLIDEYDAGRWFESSDPTTGYNCTRTPNNQNPGPDPCPWGRCDNSVNDPKFKQVCPQWDCNQIECDALQRELFANAGCYQRCSSQNAYRPVPLSIMDAALPGAGEDIMKFSGPSLYSIIQYTFGNYR